MEVKYMKKLNFYLQTKGKFGKEIRETLDTDTEYLYSKGRYKTKIRKEDLSSDYVEFRSRTIWYMTGYIKTSGVIDINYKATKLNHLFKDDYLYINYSKKLVLTKNRWGFEDYENYEMVICGSDIIPVLLAIEKNSNINTDAVRKKIKDKFNWWREKYPDDYERYFYGVTNIFEYYANKSR